MSKIVYKFDAPKNKVNHLCVLISDTLKPQGADTITFKSTTGGANETFATIIAPSNAQVVCDLANIDGEVCVHLFNDPDLKLESPLDKMFSAITKHQQEKKVSDKDFLAQFGKLVFHVGDDCVYTLDDTTCYPIYHHCTNRSSVVIHALDEQSLQRRKQDMLDILKCARANVSNAKLSNKLMMLINNLQTCKTGITVHQLRNYTFFAEKGASVKVHSMNLPCFVACNTKVDLEVLAHALVKLYVHNGDYQFVFDNLGADSDNATDVNVALASRRKKQSDEKFNLMLDYLARCLIFLEIMNETKLQINNDSSNKNIGFYNNNINNGMVNKLQYRKQTKTNPQESNTSVHTVSVDKPTMRIQYQNTHQLLAGQLRAMYASWK